MNLNTNAVVQTAALVAQVVNQTVPVLPPRGQFWALVVLSVLQGLSGVLAHFSNPDGTPAAAAYQPPVK